MNKQRKAVALISGGLDSMLAARTIQEQGIHVEGINFFTGFCVEGHTHAIREKDKAKPKRNNSLWVAEQLGIKLHIVDVIEEYKNVLLNPKHGYGQHMNPCLDCKIFMVNKAKQWIAENDFDFIITGEVMGQRPMSQRKATMPIVAKESGADDLLLRPLCAKNLPATLPEREGWVDREKLHSITGRSRKPQITMAKEFGIDEYSQPAGGCCFLTDKYYSAKLVDLWKARDSREYELDDVMLLKVGRHIRPQAHYKMIIAREEGEGRFLHGYKKDYVSMTCVSHQGPLVLIDGTIAAEDLYLAASITARYGQGRDAEQVEVNIVYQDGAERTLHVKPMLEQDMPKAWFI
ncbi:putative tRNA(5-methylaminomethyl-2-thiouridylate) methyltransferase [Crenothrix polyspora]|uniref:Putative tRNA(5-methylaminomethyl-2-thiouridylate) methyltransferase n=1 Tax=Crenothrix polyspora TaxID=360316 RepID=A0A1R4GZV3_9GAMM|nr:tRNA (5-methylaminomethyl-2-thiouridylate)-methyltransferase [Crenothrix polyspora]SJM89527.1 putative tRNA(5-methylaminomethyl-2-thiouridylate) methyltransferase [Crenothrix polyspora]